MADGGRGLTRGDAKTNSNCGITCWDALLLIASSCSSAKGSPLMGSVPFSSMNFTISLLSNTWLETGDNTGSSGTS